MLDLCDCEFHWPFGEVLKNSHCFHILSCITVGVGLILQ